MKPHLVVMIDALHHGISFHLTDGKLVATIPEPLRHDTNVMRIIRSHKAAIQDQLASGFDCVRDGLSYAEVRALTAACYHGQAMNRERLAA